MITLPVGEFKSNFSDILKKVEAGREFIISYGKRRRKVAALIPYSLFKRRHRKTRKIGVLKGKARFRLSRDWRLSDDDFLSS